MGVELRSIQHKFQALMGEVKPQIRPRFVVWLDERLAEFKVKGHMELSETLEDPQWIKDYYSSKRESKTVAIKAREAHDAGTSTESVHPKVEEQSESSNGIVHREEDLQDKEEKLDEYEADQTQLGRAHDASADETGQDFQLVEVKSEQIDEDDDDMIIVGETIAPQRQQAYPSQYNANRHMYSGFSRNERPFQRKRQKFGSLLSRPSIASSNISSVNRFKSRSKQNFRSTSSSTAGSSYPTRIATSQSQYTPSPSSQSFYAEAPSYPGDSREMYEGEGRDTHVYASETAQYSGESLRIPPHLQAQAAAELQTGEEDYEVTEGDMYADYGDESYDSSYLADATDSSLIQYDEQGNAVIKGENLAGDPSMEPMPSTSSEAMSQDHGLKTRLYSMYGPVSDHELSPSSTHYTQYLHCPAFAKPFLTPRDLNLHIAAEHGNDGDIKLYKCEWCPKEYDTKICLKQHIRLKHLDENHFICEVCSKSFASRLNLVGHMNCVHLKQRPFVCHCGSSFGYKAHLQSHLKNCKLQIL